MRTIHTDRIIEKIRQMCIDANLHLSEDVKGAICGAIESEKSPLGRQVLEQLEENMEIELSLDNFDTEIAKDTPILVDFFANWCGPCKMLAGTIERLAKESDGSYRVGKVNVDDQPELAARYNVMNIPTLIVFKNGEAVNKNVGVIPKGKILEMLK